MRTLSIVSTALAVVLAIVSGKLWLELREDRQLMADMKAQMGQEKVPTPAERQASRPGVAATTAPAVAVQTPEPMPPVAPAVQPAPVAAPLPAAVAVNRNPPVISETLRAAAMADSDQTATARVLAWKNRLEIAGQSLTTEQLQALNTAAVAQLRRETEEKLKLAITSQPTDLETAFRMKEEAVNRQNETNLRILRVVTPQLTEEQARALRAQFDSGHAARLASLRAEREQATNPNLNSNR